MDPTHLKLAAAGCGVAALAGGIIWAATAGSGADPEDDPGAPEVAGGASGLAEWAAAGAGAEVAVAVGEAGPAFTAGGAEFLPTPIPEGAALEWSTTRGDTRTVIKGEGQLDGARLLYTWELEKGDPQARLTWSIEALPLARLARPIEASWPLPEGDLEVWGEDLKPREVDAPVALDAWTPLRARWSAPGDGGQTISIAAVGADVTTAARGASPELTFTLWSPEVHPPLSGCAGVEGVAQEVGLSGELVVAFGDARVVAPMRAPAGRVATLAPVFTDPSRHPDRLLRRGVAEGVDDWAARATTLAMGHSSPDEARFGNGGLVGLDLGGAIVARPDWLGAESASALIERISGTRVELASGGSADPGAPVGVFVPESPGCSDWLASWPDGRGGLVVSLAELPTRPRTLDALAGDPVGLSPAGALAHLHLPVVDGGRGPLSGDVFSEERLGALFTSRGVGWFAAPLVSTRNPLDASATEGLLEPERRGEWTVAPEFTAALATVELLDERRDLLVTSPRQMLEYWERARRVSARELPNGGLALYNDGPPIPGFALLLEGEVSGRASDADAQRKSLDADGQVQSLLWWDLPSGPSRLSLDADAGDARLEPVTWSVTGG
jgi:hypothetical protein